MSPARPLSVATLSRTRGRVSSFSAKSRSRRCRVAKIKHIAISTQDVEATARFYKEVFGLTEVGKVDSPGARGYYLSDGDINLAILNFKHDTVAGRVRLGDQVSSHPPARQASSCAAVVRSCASYLHSLLKSIAGNSATRRSYSSLLISMYGSWSYCASNVGRNAMPPIRSRCSQIHLVRSTTSSGLYVIVTEGL